MKCSVYVARGGSVQRGEWPSRTCGGYGGWVEVGVGGTVWVDAMGVGAL